MKLSYFNPVPPNFGDELNPLIWSRLLPPGFLDDDPSDLFLGIGSILGTPFPATARKHVLGSGHGGYGPLPDVSGPDWDIRWVRGPLTARALGLAPDLAITDAAILLRVIDLPAATGAARPCFMPHFQSLDRGNWPDVCRLAEVDFLDPGADPMQLLARMRGASVIVTEAMHGAIVADALRVPWIAVRPFDPQHHMKWQDWAQSLDLDLRWADLPASTLRESLVQRTGRQGRSPRARRLLDSRALRPLGAALTHRAARALRRLAEGGRPQLSSDARIADVTDRAQHALARFLAEQGRI